MSVDGAVEILKTTERVEGERRRAERRRGARGGVVPDNSDPAAM